MSLVYLRGDAQVVLQLVEPPLMHASTMGTCSIFANHTPGKFLRFLVLRHGTRRVTTLPAMETATLQETQRIYMYFNGETIARLSRRVGRCRRKTAIAKRSELTPIHSQLR